jgi:hypothetical protein
MPEVDIQVGGSGQIGPNVTNFHLLTNRLEYRKTWGKSFCPIDSTIGNLQKTDFIL